MLVYVKGYNYLGYMLKKHNGLCLVNFPTPSPYDPDCLEVHERVFPESKVLPYVGKWEKGIHQECLGLGCAGCYGGNTIESFVGSE